MGALYRHDLAYIQGVGFGDFAGGAAPEIVRVLRSAAIPMRRVIDVGCGAGPIAAALIDGGFEVTGIDVSAELLSLARMVCPGARFIHGSIYEQEIPACQAIVAIGEPLTYHDGEDADARVCDFFRRAHDALPGGGMLIFDVVELGEPPLSARTWRSGGDWAVLVNTSEEQDSRMLVREIETFRKVGENYRRGRELHRVRLFDGAQVCAWLETEGFSVRTALGYGEFRLPRRRRAFFCTRR
jgi:SAM-dependent methyltransferase